MEDLAGEVPVVEGLARVDPLVALQPDERQVQRLGDRLGERGLAGARLALEEQRPAQREGEVADGRQRVVDEVPGASEAFGQVGGGIHCGLHSPIITPMGPLGNGGGYVAVDAAGEVAALDESHVVRREVVARAPVADRPLRHAGPVLAAEDDRVPGNSLVCGPAEAARVVADHRRRRAGRRRGRRRSGRPGSRRRSWRGCRWRPRALAEERRPCPLASRSPPPSAPEDRRPGAR